MRLSSSEHVPKPFALANVVRRALTYEEDHETPVELVLRQPDEPARRLRQPEEGEGVDVGHDHDDDGDLGEAEDLGQLEPPAGRGEVLALHRELRVLLMQYSGILLEDPTVPSGVAAEKEGRGGEGGKGGGGGKNEADLEKQGNVSRVRLVSPVEEPDGRPGHHGGVLGLGHVLGRALRRSLRAAADAAARAAQSGHVHQGERAQRQEESHEKRRAATVASAAAAAAVVALRRGHRLTPPPPGGGEDKGSLNSMIVESLLFGVRSVNAISFFYVCLGRQKINQKFTARVRYRLGLSSS